MDEPDVTARATQEAEALDVSGWDYRIVEVEPGVWQLVEAYLRRHPEDESDFSWCPATAEADRLELEDGLRGPALEAKVRAVIVEQLEAMLACARRAPILRTKAAAIQNEMGT
jgi:hypothetical protein